MSEITQLTRQIAELLTTKQQTLCTAESCTGGMIAAACTDLAGSSEWFLSGIVSYSNNAKQQLLGVNPQTLATHGAVSREVVLEMAQGMLLRGPCDWSIAVSGIAGPGGGNAEKPVGTVWLAICGPAVVIAWHEHFDGDRHQVRESTVHCALQRLKALLQG